MGSLLNRGSISRGQKVPPLGEMILIKSVWATETESGYQYQTVTSVDSGSGKGEYSVWEGGSKLFALEYSYDHQEEQGKLKVNALRVLESESARVILYEALQGVLADGGVILSILSYPTGKRLEGTKRPYVLIYV